MSSTIRRHWCTTTCSATVATSDVALVRLLAEAIVPTIEWLGDLGARFHDELDRRRLRRPVARAGRRCSVDRRGAPRRRCRDAGVEVSLGRRAERLVVHDGAVSAWQTGPRRRRSVRGGGAGGGRLRPRRRAGCAGRHFLSAPPPRARRGTWVRRSCRTPCASVHTQAQTVGHDIGLRHLHAGGDRVVEPELPGWVVLVDGDGRRV
ncbi:MAG: hypothetical protein R2713_00095 [Ilumatobacteraceae bacterium]